MKSNSVRVDVRINQQTIDALNQMPLIMQASLLAKGLPAAGRVIQLRAKELAPDGEKSGNTKKQSATTKAKMKAEVRLRDTIAVKTKKYKHRSIVMVGPKYPDGNDAFFNHGVKKASRQVWYWGRPAGIQRPMDVERVGGGLAPVFLARASDETKPAQILAIESAVREAIAKIGK